MILFKNCSVLPELMDGFSEAKCDILTDGKRIKGIYKCGECPFDSETVIDEEGRFVLPGFIDMHVHLTLSGDDTRIDNEKSGVQRGYDALKYAQDALNAGFTVLRDVGATHNIAINLRNSINKGDFVGPTIYACGLILTPTEIGNDFLPGLYSEVDTPDEIIKAVRQEVAKGADYIKVMGSGSAQNPGGEPGKPIITLEDMKVMVEAAAFKDTYVVKQLQFADLRLIKENKEGNKEILGVLPGQLQYPSLNEVNYIAFNEVTEEYHDELYSFIEFQGWKNSYIQGKPTRLYKRVCKNNSIIDEQKVLSEYIRHQIHHPDNKNNPRYTREELKQSIDLMRAFIARQSVAGIVEP